MKYLNLFFIFILFIHCKNDKAAQDKNNTTAAKAQTPINVVVLLDLSDRLKLSNQVAKDQEIIRNILNAFEQEQRKYGFMASKDKLSLSVAFQNSSKYNQYDLGNNRFMIDMLYKNANPMNKPVFDEKKRAFDSAVVELYQKAIKSPTDGADVWGFFCTGWNNVYQADKKNKVIILTDGYLQFSRDITSKRPTGTYMTSFDKMRNQSDWEKTFNRLKLTPCPASLSNTEVLVLEVSPKNKSINTNEFQIISKFWKTWFDDMKTYSEVYETSDVSGFTNDKITNFIKK
jgi:hypothetical protein